MNRNRRDADPRALQSPRFGPGLWRGWTQCPLPRRDPTRDPGLLCLASDPRSSIAACRLEAKVSAALFTPARWSGWQRGTVAPLPWPVPRSRARWRARCRRPSHGVGAERNSRHAARSGLLSSAPAGSGPATGVPVVWAASGPGHRDQALTFDFAGGSLPPGCHPAGLPESVRPAGGPCEEA